MADWNKFEEHEDSFLPCTPVLNSDDVYSLICNCNLSHLSILHSNIRSLRANFDELICYLSKLELQFDIIILSEIWVKTQETNLYSIDGYSEFFHCRDFNKSGGIVIYLKNTNTLFDFVLLT